MILVIDFIKFWVSGKFLFSNLTQWKILLKRWIERSSLKSGDLVGQVNNKSALDITSNVCRARKKRMLIIIVIVVSLEVGLETRFKEQILNYLNQMTLRKKALHRVGPSSSLNSSLMPNSPWEQTKEQSKFHFIALVILVFLYRRLRYG